MAQMRKAKQYTVIIAQIFARPLLM